MKSLLLLILKSFIFAQRTRDQALQIASKILSTSTNYYNISSLDGAVARDYKDNYNTPWFESGILWEAVFRYTQTTHDESKIGFAAKAIRNSSFGEEGSFLGPPSLHKISATVVGKWNDDILWWALPCLTAAETYGSDAQIPDGAGFLQTAKNTIDQAYENYDLNVCGGGLFWPRFPELAHLVKPETYKSTITNSLFVYACARLYRLTNDAEYLKRAQQVYDWLYRIKFIGSQGQVFDGAHAMDCLNIDDREYSYNNGQFLLANIQLFKATNNATFKQNAQSVYNRSKQLFIVNNIIKDSFCEPNCRPGLRFHKAILVKSLVEYYTIASPQEQQEIKSAVTNSFDNMLVNNCDSNYNCGSLWDTKVNNFDFHTQIGALELANAYINVNYGGEKLKRVGFGGPENNLASYQSVAAVFLGISTFWFLKYIY